MAKANGIEISVDGVKVGVVKSFQPSDRRIEPVKEIEPCCSGSQVFGPISFMHVAGPGNYGRRVVISGRQYGKTYAQDIEVQRLKMREFRERGGLGDEHVRS